MGDMQKLKKLKITLTGTSETLQVNDLGSPYLHFRNQVAITKIGKSKVGRAIVLDQHIIDKSFMEQKLTAEQHNVCNRYLELIAKIGALGESFGLGKEIFTSKYWSGLIIISKVGIFIRNKTIFKYPSSL